MSDWQARAEAAEAKVAAVDALADAARMLVSDWQANGNASELGDPCAEVWQKCALQLLGALDRAALASVGRTEPETSGGGVGTGASGENDPGHASGEEATVWVNRSVDCPEAPAQAHTSLACSYGAHDWVRAGGSTAGSMSIFRRKCRSCGADYVVSKSEWEALPEDWWPGRTEPAPEAGGA